MNFLQSSRACKPCRSVFDLRQSGDYDDYTEFSKVTLQDLLPDAEKFLENIENILTKNH